MEKMVTKEWAKANSSDTGFFEFLTSSLVLVIRHVFHFTSKMFFAMGDDLSYGLNTLGPLCLWQCLMEHLIEEKKCFEKGDKITLFFFRGP